MKKPPVVGGFALQVNHLAFDAVRHLVEDLAERGVGVDVAGDFFGG